MGFLPSLKISFEKPSLDVHEEVKNLMRKPLKAKKDDLPQFWSHKERLLVILILAVTILGSVYFYYRGQGKTPEFQISVPSFNFGGFGLNQTITVE